MGDHFLAALRQTVLLAEGDSSTFKVAIVTTLGVVIAAAITSYAATFQRNKAPDPAPAPVPAPAPEDPALVRELRRRAEKAEKRVLELDAEKDRLEILLWQAHVNPATGESTNGDSS